MAPLAATKSNSAVSARGQRVVVSGATQGIGLAVALHFAKAGAEVWVVGRNAKTGAEVIKQLIAAAPKPTNEDSETPQPEFRFFQADFNSLSQTSESHAASQIASARG